MSSLSVRLPDSLHDSVREISKKDHISINQFIASAVAEKITAMETEEYLASRAERGNVNKFRAVMKKVKDRPADERDT